MSEDEMPDRDPAADFGVAVESAAMRLLRRLEGAFGDSVEIGTPDEVEFTYRITPGTGEILVGVTFGSVTYAEDPDNGGRLVAMREARGVAEIAEVSDDGTFGPWLKVPPPKGRADLN